MTPSEQTIADVWGDVLEQFRLDSNINTQEVARYIAERGAHLEASVGQPGYDVALRAEADALTLFLHERGVAVADAADRAVLRGVVGTILSLVARVSV